MSLDAQVVRAISELPQVSRIRVDMCTFGLNVTGEGLNKKPTGILTNHPRPQEILGGCWCDGSHKHVLLEGKSRTSRAQVYPPRFVEAVARAVTEQWSGASQGRK
eukprot:6702432-Pyramimonas_sp.AAC.1